MYLPEVGWCGVDWIGVDQDRDKRRALVNAIMNLPVPQNAGKPPRGYSTSGLSSSAHLHVVG
jgi:hypothetical protein